MMSPMPINDPPPDDTDVPHEHGERWIDSRVGHHTPINDPPPDYDDSLYSAEARGASPGAPIGGSTPRPEAGLDPKLSLAQRFRKLLRRR